MMAQHTKGIAISLIVIGIVLFVLFIDIGLLPNGCSPHNALLVGDRPASRGAWGLWACQGTKSIVLGIIVPLCLLALSVVLMAPKRGEPGG